MSRAAGDIPGPTAEQIAQAGDILRRDNEQAVVSIKHVNSNNPLIIQDISGIADWWVEQTAELASSPEILTMDRIDGEVDAKREEYIRTRTKEYKEQHKSDLVPSQIADFYKQRARVQSVSHRTKLLRATVSKADVISQLLSSPAAAPDFRLYFDDALALYSAADLAILSEILRVAQKICEDSIRYYGGDQTLLQKGVAGHRDEPKQEEFKHALAIIRAQQQQMSRAMLWHMERSLESADHFGYSSYPASYYAKKAAEARQTPVEPWIIADSKLPQNNLMARLSEETSKSLKARVTAVSGSCDSMGIPDRTNNTVMSVFTQHIQECGFGYAHQMVLAERIRRWNQTFERLNVAWVNWETVNSNAAHRAQLVAMRVEFDAVRASFRATTAMRDASRETERAKGLSVISTTIKKWLASRAVEKAAVASTTATERVGAVDAARQRQEVAQDEAGQKVAELARQLDECVQAANDPRLLAQVEAEQSDKVVEALTTHFESALNNGVANTAAICFSYDQNCELMLPLSMIPAVNAAKQGEPSALSAKDKSHVVALSSMMLQLNVHICHFELLARQITTILSNKDLPTLMQSRLLEKLNAAKACINQQINAIKTACSNKKETAVLQRLLSDEQNKTNALLSAFNDIVTTTRQKMDARCDAIVNACTETVVEDHKSKNIPLVHDSRKIPEFALSIPSDAFHALADELKTLSPGCDLTQKVSMLDYFVSQLFEHSQRYLVPVDDKIKTCAGQLVYQLSDQYYRLRDFCFDHASREEGAVITVISDLIAGRKAVADMSDVFEQLAQHPVICQHLSKTTQEWRESFEKNYLDKLALTDSTQAQMITIVQNRLINHINGANPHLNPGGLLNWLLERSGGVADVIDPVVQALQTHATGQYDGKTPYPHTQLLATFEKFYKDQRPQQHPPLELIAEIARKRARYIAVEIRASTQVTFTREDYFIFSRAKQANPDILNDVFAAINAISISDFSSQQLHDLSDLATKMGTVEQRANYLAKVVGSAAHDLLDLMKAIITKESAWEEILDSEVQRKDQAVREIRSAKQKFKGKQTQQKIDPRALKIDLSHGLDDTGKAELENAFIRATVEQLMNGLIEQLKAENADITVISETVQARLRIIEDCFDIDINGDLYNKLVSEFWDTVIAQGVNDQAPETQCQHCFQLVKAIGTHDAKTTMMLTGLCDALQRANLEVLLQETSKSIRSDNGLTKLWFSGPGLILSSGTPGTSDDLQLLQTYFSITLDEPDEKLDAQWMVKFCIFCHDYRAECELTAEYLLQLRKKTLDVVLLKNDNVALDALLRYVSILDTTTNTVDPNPFKIDEGYLKSLQPRPNEETVRNFLRWWAEKESTNPSSASSLHAATVSADQQANLSWWIRTLSGVGKFQGTENEQGNLRAIAKVFSDVGYYTADAINQKIGAEHAKELKNVLQSHLEFVLFDHPSVLPVFWMYFDKFKNARLLVDVDETQVSAFRAASDAIVELSKPAVSFNLSEFKKHLAKLQNSVLDNVYGRLLNRFQLMAQEWISQASAKPPLLSLADAQTHSNALIEALNKFPEKIKQSAQFKFIHDHLPRIFEHDENQVSKLFDKYKKLFIAWGRQEFSLTDETKPKPDELLLLAMALQRDQKRVLLDQLLATSTAVGNNADLPPYAAIKELLNATDRTYLQSNENADRVNTYVSQTDIKQRTAIDACACVLTVLNQDSPEPTENDRQLFQTLPAKLSYLPKLSKDSLVTALEKLSKKLLDEKLAPNHVPVFTALLQHRHFERKKQDLLKSANEILEATLQPNAAALFGGDDASCAKNQTVVLSAYAVLQQLDPPAAAEYLERVRVQLYPQMMKYIAHGGDLIKINQPLVIALFDMAGIQSKVLLLNEAFNQASCQMVWAKIPLRERMVAMRFEFATEDKEHRKSADHQRASQEIDTMILAMESVPNEYRDNRVIEAQYHIAALAREMRYADASRELICLEHSVGGGRGLQVLHALLPQAAFQNQAKPAAEQFTCGAAREVVGKAEENFKNQLKDILKQVFNYEKFQGKEGVFGFRKPWSYVDSNTGMLLRDPDQKAQGRMHEVFGGDQNYLKYRAALNVQEKLNRILQQPMTQKTMDELNALVRYLDDIASANKEHQNSALKFSGSVFQLSALKAKNEIQTLIKDWQMGQQNAADAAAVAANAEVRLRQQEANEVFGSVKAALESANTYAAESPLKSDAFGTIFNSLNTECGTTFADTYRVEFFTELNKVNLLEATPAFARDLQAFLSTINDSRVAEYKTAQIANAKKVLNQALFTSSAAFTQSAEFALSQTRVMAALTVLETFDAGSVAAYRDHITKYLLPMARYRIAHDDASAFNASLAAALSEKVVLASPPTPATWTQDDCKKAWAAILLPVQSQALMHDRVLTASPFPQDPIRVTALSLVGRHDPQPKTDAETISLQKQYYIAALVCEKKYDEVKFELSCLQAFNPDLPLTEVLINARPSSEPAIQALRAMITGRSVETSGKDSFEKVADAILQIKNGAPRQRAASISTTSGSGTPSNRSFGQLPSNPLFSGTGRQSDIGPRESVVSLDRGASSLQLTLAERRRLVLDPQQLCIDAITEAVNNVLAYENFAADLNNKKTKLSGLLVSSENKKKYQVARHLKKLLDDLNNSPENVVAAVDVICKLLDQMSDPNKTNTVGVTIPAETGTGMQVIYTGDKFQGLAKTASETVKDQFSKLQNLSTENQEKQEPAEPAEERALQQPAGVSEGALAAAADLTLEQSELKKFVEEFVALLPENTKAKSINVDIACKLDSYLKKIGKADSDIGGLLLSIADFVINRNEDETKDAKANRVRVLVDTIKLNQSTKYRASASSLQSLLEKYYKRKNEAATVVANSARQQPPVQTIQQPSSSASPRRPPTPEEAQAAKKILDNALSFEGAFLGNSDTMDTPEKRAAYFKGLTDAYEMLKKTDPKYVADYDVRLKTFVYARFMDHVVHQREYDGGLRVRYDGYFEQFLPCLNVDLPKGLHDIIESSKRRTPAGAAAVSQVAETSVGQPSFFGGTFKASNQPDFVDKCRAVWAEMPLETRLLGFYGDYLAKWAVRCPGDFKYDPTTLIDSITKGSTSTSLGVLLEKMIIFKDELPASVVQKAKTELGALIARGELMQTATQTARQKSGFGALDATQQNIAIKEAYIIALLNKTLETRTPPAEAEKFKKEACGELLALLSIKRDLKLDAIAGATPEAATNIIALVEANGYTVPTDHPLRTQAALIADVRVIHGAGK